MDAPMVESRRREFVDSRVHRDSARSCSHRNRDVPRSGMESIFVEPELRQHGGVSDNCGVSSRTRSPGREAQPNCRAGAYLGGGVQWIGVAGHVDREPSKSPRESRYDRGCLQPPSRWILVGASAVAVSMAAIADEEVVSGSDPAAIYDLGKPSNPACPRVDLLWLFPAWLGRPLLDGRDPPCLLPSHAGLREQSSASEAGTCGRSRFQPEHMVARPVPAHRMGRELARQPPRKSRLGPLQPPLVAG